MVCGCTGGATDAGLLGGGVVGANDFVVSGEDVGAGSVLRLWTRLRGVGADDLVVCGEDVGARSVLCDWASLSGVGTDNLVVAGHDIAGGVLGLRTRWGGVGADDLVIASKEIEVL